MFQKFKCFSEELEETKNGAKRRICIRHVDPMGGSCPLMDPQIGNCEFVWASFFPLVVRKRLNAALSEVRFKLCALLQSCQSR